MSDPIRQLGPPRPRAVGTVRAAVVAVGILLAAAAIGALGIACGIAFAEAVPGAVGFGLAALAALGGLGLAVAVGVGGLLLVSGSHAALTASHRLPPHWWLPRPRDPAFHDHVSCDHPDQLVREPDPT